MVDLSLDQACGIAKGNLSAHPLNAEVLFTRAPTELEGGEFSCLGTIWRRVLLFDLQMLKVQEELVVSSSFLPPKLHYLCIF